MTWQCLRLAAPDEAALDAALASTLSLLQSGRLPAATTGSGPLRLFLVHQGPEDALAALQANEAKRVVRGNADGRNRNVAFMFSGQGSQYVGMGRGLYETFPTFSAAVDRCSALLEPELGVDLRQVWYPAAGSEEAATEQLNSTRLTQPSLFVIEYALASLWRSWGLEPQAMVGHSIGEYVAATLAGVFELEDALRLVAQRGALMQSLPAGTMLSVPMDEKDLLPKLPTELSLAAINAAGRSVVSGPHEAVDAFAAAMKAERVPCAKLHTSHAFHSHMMDPILPEFEATVAQVTRRKPTLPYVSNVSGTWIEAEQAQDPSYYGRHLRGTVRFADNAATLLADPDRILLEVGPGNTLVQLTQRHPARVDQPILASMRHPKEKDLDDVAFALATVGQLFLAGLDLDV